MEKVFNGEKFGVANERCGNHAKGERGEGGRGAATAIRSNYAAAANDKQLLEGGTEWYMVQREGRQADGESG